MNIIQVTAAEVILYEANTDKEIGSFTVSQFNSTFTVNGIPSCTAMLTAGANLSAPTYDYTKLMNKLLTTYTVSGIRLVAYITCSNTTKITVFNGVVTSISLATRIAPYGNSTDCIVVNARHNYADLYKIGSNGMIYKEPSNIKRGTSLVSLIKLINASAKDDENNTNNMGSTVVNEVRDAHTKKDAAGAGSKGTSPISVVTKAMIDRMYSGKILEPPKIDISKYINGTTSINDDLVAVAITRTFTKKYLDQIWASVSRSSVGAAILTILNNREFMLSLVPRSVDKLTILPEDGITIYKDHPVITTSMYNSINYSINDDIHPDPEGVLVTRQGSEVMAGGGSGYGVVLGAYPKIASNGSNKAIRWSYVQAPSWLADNTMVESSISKNKTDGMTTAEYNELCDKYAEWLYRSHVHKNNTITLSTDIRFIEAIKALGAVCEIHTIAYGPVKGRLFSYGLTFTQTASQSNLSINLHFSHVVAYMKDNEDTTVNGLYKVDDSDIVKKLPDITANG